MSDSEKDPRAEPEEDLIAAGATGFLGGGVLGVLLGLGVSAALIVVSALALVAVIWFVCG